MLGTFNHTFLPKVKFPSSLAHLVPGVKYHHMTCVLWQQVETCSSPVCWDSSGSYSATPQPVLFKALRQGRWRRIVLYILHDPNDTCSDIWDYGKENIQSMTRCSHPSAPETPGLLAYSKLVHCHVGYENYIKMSFIVCQYSCSQNVKIPGCIRGVFWFDRKVSVTQITTLYLNTLHIKSRRGWATTTEAHVKFQFCQPNAVGTGSPKHQSEDWKKFSLV